MGVLDKFLDAIKLNDDYDDDEFLDEDLDGADDDDDDFLDDEEDIHIVHIKTYVFCGKRGNILQKQRNLNIRAIQSDIKVVFLDKWYYNKGYEK